MFVSMRFSIIVSCLPVVIRAYFFSKARFLKYDNLLQQSPQESHLSALYMCVGTEVRATSPPLPNNDGKKSDSDPSWRTTKPPGTETIVPFNFDISQLEKPQLITFSCWNTLIQPSQSIGRWYREALNTVCNMQIRLPRPQFFSVAFNKAYADMSSRHPFFGASSGMSTRSWWAAVIEQTYRQTEYLTEIETDEWPQLLPELVEMLYETVFNTKEGWVVKEDVEYTLKKLTDWRDQGGGPKIGIIDNFDERLDNILTELNIRSFFDFVLVSQKTGSEKPSAEMFHLARQTCGLSTSSSSLPTSSSPLPTSSPLSVHVGISLTEDVAGAHRAGYLPIHFSENFDESLPDWTQIESEEEAESGAEKRKEVLLWGRRDLNPDPKSATGGQQWLEIWGLDDILFLFGLPDDPNKPIKTTYLRAVLED